MYSVAGSFQLQHESEKFEEYESHCLTTLDV